METVFRKQHQIAVAVALWLNTMLRLCDENFFGSHADEYSHFVTNAFNVENNPDMREKMKQIVYDFYDYFYINQHICEINNIKDFDKLDNNYGTGSLNLRIFDILQKIKNNSKLKCVVQQITIYVFYLCIHARTELGLFVYDDPQKDEQLVKFFERIPEN